MTDFKPRAPIFDGKVDSWEPFIMQLRFMCKTYCWPEWKFHEQLLFALRGEALQFAATLNPTVREDSVLLLGALEQRFGQSLLAETYRANLYNIKKTSKESIQEYSARVNQLMTRAYPGMEGTAIYNNLLIEHLLKGMPDQRLAYEVLTRKPRNLNEAVEMITWHEACRQYTMKTSDIRMVKSDEFGEPSEDQFAKDHELRGVKNRKVTQEDDYSSQLSQLHKDLQNISRRLNNLMNLRHGNEQRWPNSRNRKEVICFKCQQPGHIAPDCPEKRTKTPSTDRPGPENQEN